MTPLIIYSLVIISTSNANNHRYLYLHIYNYIYILIRNAQTCSSKPASKVLDNGVWILESSQVPNLALHGQNFVVFDPLFPLIGLFGTFIL